MAETKELKIRFSTVICIILIVLLLAGCIALYYFGFVQKDKQLEKVKAEKLQVETKNAELEKQIIVVEKEVETKKTQESENESSKSSTSGILTEAEIQEILGPDDAEFCIEDIKKDGEDYIITAYMLEKGKRLIYEKEYQDLKNGKEIEFRKQKWTLIYNDKLDQEFLQSGKDQLSIPQVLGNRRLIGNSAGSDAILSDYSNQKISFRVSKDILIGDMWMEFKYIDGKITASAPDTEASNLSFDDLKTMSEGCRGSYDECVAYVKDGKVDAIKIFNQ